MSYARWSKGLILVILLFSFSSMGEIAYRAYVDTDYGFYKVSIISNVTNPIEYVNKTLTIDAGDNIEWVNCVTSGENLTLVDNTGNHTVKFNYQKYSRKFTTPGRTYMIGIKEYPGITPQTIVVRSVPTPILFMFSDV